MARSAKCGLDNAPGARFCGESGGGLSAAVQAKSLDIDRSGLLPDSQDLAYFAPGDTNVFARPRWPSHGVENGLGRGWDGLQHPVPKMSASC